MIRDGVDEEQLTIDYDIALSTSYHVPVMYFCLRETPQVGPAALDDIYNFLVPRQHQQSLRNNGVMGGISFGVCHDTPSRCWFCDFHELIKNSIIPSPAFQLTSFTLVTPPVPWKLLPAIKTLSPKIIFSHGSALLVAALI